MNDAIGKGPPDRILERAMAAEARVAELGEILTRERRIRDRDAARLKEALDKLAAIERATDEERLASAIDVVNALVVVPGDRAPDNSTEHAIVVIACDGVYMRSFQQRGIPSARVAQALRDGLLKVAK